MDNSVFECRPHEGRGRARAECAELSGRGITDVPRRVLIKSAYKGFGGTISGDFGELAYGRFSQLGMRVVSDEFE